MFAFAARMLRLWQCGVKHSAHFLRALNSFYRILRAAILSVPPIPSMDALSLYVMALFFRECPNTLLKKLRCMYYPKTTQFVHSRFFPVLPGVDKRALA
jgi:hypothetical protein